MCLTVKCTGWSLTRPSVCVLVLVSPSLSCMPLGGLPCFCCIFSHFTVICLVHITHLQWKTDPALSTTSPLSLHQTRPCHFSFHHRHVLSPRHHSFFQRHVFSPSSSFMLSISMVNRNSERHSGSLEGVLLSVHLCLVPHNRHCLLHCWHLPSSWSSVLWRWIMSGFMSIYKHILGCSGELHREFV